jgi:hypothetical protein
MEIQKKLGQFLCLSNMIGEKFKIWVTDQM